MMGGAPLPTVTVGAKDDEEGVVVELMASGGGGGVCSGSEAPPPAFSMAPVNPENSCLPASEIWFAKSLTPLATLLFPVIPKSVVKVPVKLLKLLAKLAPSLSKGRASSPVTAKDSMLVLSFSNWKFKTTTPAMITRPIATRRTVWVTIEQVWHLVLPWIFCISAWSKGASSMSTSSSCAPSLSTAISSTGLSLLCREATGSTGMSYAGFLALITRFWGGWGRRARASRAVVWVQRAGRQQR